MHGNHITRHSGAHASGMTFSRVYRVLTKSCNLRRKMHVFIKVGMVTILCHVGGAFHRISAKGTLVSMALLAVAWMASYIFKVMG